MYLLAGCVNVSLCCLKCFVVDHHGLVVFEEALIPPTVKDKRLIRCCLDAAFGSPLEVFSSWQRTGESSLSRSSRVPMVRKVANSSDSQEYST